MATTHFRTAVLLVAGLTLAATPSYAQRNGRRNGGEGGRQDGGGQRAEPRDGAQRAEPRGGAERVQPRGGADRSESGRIAPRPDVAVPRADQFRSNGNRTFNNRSFDNRSFNNRSFDNRSYGNRSYDNRSYNNRSYNNRSYAYGNRYYGGRSYVYPSYRYNRSYVLPYGYRPYGYRPGWSLNLYFGRPYGGYAYPSAGYGYYSIAPGLNYGSLRIVDAPPDAQVFVDGYYAGVVDDYDGVFQHLNLEVGSHHIEIQVEDPGYPPIAFDVRIEPGQTITYRANGRY